MGDLCEFSSTRRSILGMAGTLFAWSSIPRAAAAAGGRDPRLVTIVLRGALDGLSAVPPVGDPAYQSLRGPIALEVASRGSDQPNMAIPLDSFFALHPSMPNLARLFRAGQAAIVHAVATSYRARSHFDGQDVLESGWPAPGQTRDGWLNRAALVIPAVERVRQPKASVLAVGAVPPLIVRGAAPIFGWSPALPVRSNADTAERVLNIYAARDPALAAQLQKGLETDQIARDSLRGRDSGRFGTASTMRTIAEGASRIIAADDGPRIAALAFDGWDTHANEGGATGRLSVLLGGLDAALQAFEETLKDRWRDTVLMIMTEFGRTAQVNGTVGTDHGTGTVVLIVGGAVKGGRMIADWPGLRAASLYEGRDLAPTIDLRSLAKGILSDLYGVTPSALNQIVFPGSEGIKAYRGLVA